MRTQIRLFSIVTLMLFITFMSYSQDSGALLTFENAYWIMQENSPVLECARQKVKQKQFEKAAKKGLYMPSVSVGALGVSMSKPLELDLTPIRDAILPLYDALGNYGVFSGVPNPDPNTNAFLPVLPNDMSTAGVRQNILNGRELVAAGEWEKVIQERNFAKVSADFIWPIFTGGKILAANKAAGLELEMGQHELMQMEGEMLSELVIRYYGLVLAKQGVEVHRKMFEAMDKHLNDAEKLFNEGMIAKVEFLHASVTRNEAERELKQAIRNVEIIEAGLKATLASDNLSLVILASNLFVNSNLPQLEDWLLLTLANNPQLKQIEGKKELVKIKDRSEKGEFLPTVTMMGTYNIVEKDFSPYAPDWMVGVGVQWSVFEGLARNHKSKATQTLFEQVAQAEIQANENLEAYITKLYHELNMLLEQVDELQGTLELASEYSESTQKAFNEGFATSTAVTDALLKVAQVQILRLKVYFEYDVTLSTLLKTAGVPAQFLDYCQGDNTIYEKLN